MPVVEVHARDPRVWSAVKKFEGYVSPGIPEQAVVAHAESVAGVIAAGIPRVNRGHSAGIRCDQSGKGKDTMPVAASAGHKSGNHCMSQSRENACAFAAVIQSVLAKGLSQSIPCSRAYPGNAEDGCVAFAVTFCSLLPLGRSLVRLVDA